VNSAVHPGRYEARSTGLEPVTSGVTVSKPFRPERPSPSNPLTLRRAGPLAGVRIAPASSCDASASRLPAPGLPRLGLQGAAHHLTDEHEQRWGTVVRHQGLPKSCLREGDESGSVNRRLVRGGVHVVDGAVHRLLHIVPVDDSPYRQGVHGNILDVDRHLRERRHVRVAPHIGL
jgi:hypothetical protein